MLRAVRLAGAGHDLYGGFPGILIVAEHYFCKLFASVLLINAYFTSCGQGTVMAYLRGFCGNRPVICCQDCEIWIVIVAAKPVVRDGNHIIDLRGHGPVHGRQ